jgi:hypothetical protein
MYKYVWFFLFITTYSFAKSIDKNLKSYNLTHLKAKDDSTYAYLKNVSNILKKRNVCFLTFTKVDFSGRSSGTESYMDLKFSNIPCFIDKKKYCTLVLYNLKKMKFIRFNDDKYDDIVASNSCLDGGFEQLLKKEGRWRATSYYTSPQERNKEEKLETYLFKQEYSYQKILGYPILTSKDKKFYKHLSVIIQDHFMLSRRKPIDPIDLYQSRRRLCNAYLISKKFPKKHYHRTTLNFTRELAEYTKEYGAIKWSVFLDNHCKKIVKTEICGNATVQNIGVLSDYFSYGYPDLNVMFRVFKNSKDVALELCGAKEDFSSPSKNMINGYPTSIK